MKKNLMKLSALVLVAALTFAIAACAQPTETTEAARVGSTPVVVRLYLDRPESSTLGYYVDGRDDELNAAQIQLRAGVELNSDLYPVPEGETPVDNSVKLQMIGSAGAGDYDPLAGLDYSRVEVRALAGGRKVINTARGTVPDVSCSILENRWGSKKYFESPVLRVAKAASGNGALTPIAVTTSGQFYVDIELVNFTPGAFEYGSIMNETLSVYLEVDVSQPGKEGRITPATYVYTAEKTTFNNWVDEWVDWDVSNSNIKKIELKPGINEVYFAQFSAGNKFDARDLVP